MTEEEARRLGAVLCARCHVPYPVHHTPHGRCPGFLWVPPGEPPTPAPQAPPPPPSVARPPRPPRRIPPKLSLP
jgi:hypothetical protein